MFLKTLLSSPVAKLVLDCRCVIVAGVRKKGVKDLCVEMFSRLNKGSRDERESGKTSLLGVAEGRTKLRAGEATTRALGTETQPTCFPTILGY